MKTIKLGLTITSRVFIIVWLIRIFIEWDLINPFDWIIKMPTYEKETRGEILFFYALFWLILMLDAWVEKDYKKLTDKLKDDEEKR